MSDVLFSCTAYLAVGAIVAGCLIGFGSGGTRASSLGRAALFTLLWWPILYVVLGLGLGVAIRKARGATPLD